MTTGRSPLAPEAFPDLPAVRGVRLATLAAGLRYEGRPDLMLTALAPDTVMAGVFTQSLCPSAPVDWCRQVLSGGRGRAIVCNAGNANAFTGSAGQQAARRTAETVGRELAVDPHTVFLASTGVIGEPMPDGQFDEALPRLVGELADSSGSGWKAAADAIRTTDTFNKGAGAAIAGTDAHVVGIAKGSGMIAPDMATMLAFVFTDLAVGSDVLQSELERAVAASFNRITVDSDTSTSDTVLLAATGVIDASGPSEVASDGRVPGFAGALDDVMVDLAHQIVRDGEGATKFVTVSIAGAATDAAAATIGRAVAESPLVKTALAAEDANWGRIVMAVGKAGEKADRDRLAIWIGDEQCAVDGFQHPDYDEARATRHLRRSEIEISVDVGVGTGASTIWTCDLTHGYIDINAGYRS